MGNRNCSTDLGRVDDYWVLGPFEKQLRYVFMGDYVDRGASAAPVASLACLLRLLHVQDFKIRVPCCNLKSQMPAP